MAANIEHALIAQILRTKDFHTVQKLQLDEGFFTSPEAKELYRYIRNIYMAPGTSGQVISEQMMRERFPNAFLPPAYDSVSVLAQQLRHDRVQSEILRLSQELQVLASTDPMEAVAALRAESAKIASLSEAGSDLNLSSVSKMLLDKYETVQASKGVLGVPFPWDAMNQETQGMQGGQFIVFYGRPKQMKSWIALYCAVHAYLFSRKRVLFYTREMTPFLVAQRAAAMIAKVDYAAYKRGQLQPEIKAMMFQMLSELMDDEKGITQHGQTAHPACFVITTDRSVAAGGGGGGVMWLQAKIRDLKPDIVFVDGMYLMKDDRSNTRSVDWKNIAGISQDLKLTAQDFDIPVVGVTQANRAADKSKGEDLTELSYADAIGQDADAVFRVRKKVRIDENNAKHNEVYITAPGIREAVFDGIVINAEPATDFSFARTIVEEDNNEHDDGYSKPPPKNGGNGVHKPFKVMDPKVSPKALKGTV